MSEAGFFEQYWHIITGLIFAFTVFFMAYAYFIIDRITKRTVKKEFEAVVITLDTSNKKFKTDLQETFDETLEEIQDTLKSVVTKENAETKYLTKESAHDKFYNKELANATFVKKESI